MKFNEDNFKNISKRNFTLSAFFIFMILVFLSVAYFFGKMNRDYTIVMKSNETYSSLVGMVEEIPDVERWVIHRYKKTVGTYKNINWSLELEYNNGTSIKFGERESINNLIQDLERIK